MFVCEDDHLNGLVLAVYSLNVMHFVPYIFYHDAGRSEVRGDLTCLEKALRPLLVDDRLHGDVDMTEIHGEGATLARPPVRGDALATTGRSPPERRCWPVILSKLLACECRDCLEDRDESSAFEES